MARHKRGVGGIRVQKEAMDSMRGLGEIVETSQSGERESSYVLEEQRESGIRDL